jgi:hypothetical protein
VEYKLFRDNDQELIWIETEDGEVKVCLTIPEWTYLISHPVVKATIEEPLLA